MSESPIAGIELFHIGLPTRREHKWTGLQEPIGGYVILKMTDAAGLIGCDLAHHRKRSAEYRRALKLRADAVGHNHLAHIGNRPHVGNREVPLAVDRDFDAGHR